MARPIVYGAAYSVYVQAVRLTLAAKAAAYDLVEVDVFAPGGPGPQHLARHPFGRIPAFEHDGLTLYETAPICRYVDEAFSGPALQPADAAPRAVMGQAISVMDNYAYRSMVWGSISNKSKRRGADARRTLTNSRPRGGDPPSAWRLWSGWRHRATGWRATR
jgi:glutathione S-transferase